MNKLWNGIQNRLKSKQPATKKSRVCAVLKKHIPPLTARQKELKMAREVLETNRELRRQKKPFKLQLKKSEKGFIPEVILIDTQTGAPIENLSYEHICDLAYLTKDQDDRSVVNT